MICDFSALDHALDECTELCLVLQAELEAERLTLQGRLKDALKLHMAPRMQLDTSSVIDRTVTLLDALLEASMLHALTWSMDLVPRCLAAACHHCGSPITDAELSPPTASWASASAGRTLFLLQLLTMTQWSVSDSVVSSDQILIMTQPLVTKQQLRHACRTPQGRAPATNDIVAARNTLLQSSDLRRVSDLEKQLKGQANLSADASQSLVSLLQVSPGSWQCAQFIALAYLALAHLAHVRQSHMLLSEYMTVQGPCFI